MTLPVQKPTFPLPPDSYDADYMKNLIKQLELYINRLNSQGALRGTTLNLSQLPTATTGLASGDLWNDLGVVKIVP